MLLVKEACCVFLAVIHVAMDIDSVCCDGGIFVKQES